MFPHVDGEQRNKTWRDTITHTLRFNRPFFQVNLGKPVAPLILIVHLLLDCASFWDRPKLSMSYLTQSHQVYFGRPLCLITSTSHVIQRLTQSLSSFRSTCPHHLNLLFLIIKLTGSNPKSSQSSPLFFLSKTSMAKIQFKMATW